MTYNEKMEILEKAAVFARKRGQPEKAKSLRLTMMRTILRRMVEIKTGKVTP